VQVKSAGEAGEYGGVPSTFGGRECGNGKTTLDEAAAQPQALWGMCEKLVCFCDATRRVGRVGGKDLQGSIRPEKQREGVIGLSLPVL